MLVTINEEIVDANPFRLSLLDRGFLLGDGIFETLRVYCGAAFKQREHVDRLNRSADRLEIALDADINSLINRELKRAETIGLTSAYLRVTLTRGTALGLGGQPPSSTLSTILSTLPNISPETYSRGIRVVTSPGRRNEFALSSGLKTTACLDSVLAFRAANKAGMDDALFLDTGGHLSEATASNIFLYSDDVLFTPPLTCGALPGITREVVIGLAANNQLRVVDNEPLNPRLIGEASEIFLTSSIREIVPVVSVDGTTVGPGVPGEVTKKIVAAYSAITGC